jgi:hypothetical protein
MLHRCYIKNVTKLLCAISLYSHLGVYLSKGAVLYDTLDPIFNIKSHAREHPINFIKRLNRICST